MIPILLLAAGQSRRMRGRDKLIEPIKGQPLLRRVALRCLATSHPVFIALPSEPHARYDALNALEVIRIPVPDAQKGMSTSLKTGISNLPEHVQGALVVLADMPDLETEHIRAVINARSTHPKALIWRGANQHGKPGHPVLFDASLFPNLKALEGDDGAQSVVQSALPHVHLVTSLGEAALTDLDTPEAWENWRQVQSHIK